MATKGLVRVVKALAAAAALTVASSGAMANSVNSGFTVTGGTSFFGALHTESGSFVDTLTFSPTDGLVLTNAIISTSGSGSQNIDFDSVELNGHALSLTPHGFFEIGQLPDTLLKGPLTLVVKGKSDSSGGIFSSYSGTLNIVAVPEAETYALMMIGLVGLGLHSLRRKSNA